MLRRPLGRPRNRWEDDIRNDMKKLKIKIGLTASRIVIIGNYMLKRPKHSKIEIVVPKEEEVDTPTAIKTDKDTENI
jgi:hypothetical protein